MKAILGWGRPLYDEELAKFILQRKGMSDPSIQTIQNFAKQLRRKTLHIRILSIVTAIILFSALIRALLR
jgi:hypothetical protein